jgi:hypothetical protein
MALDIFHCIKVLIEMLVNFVIKANIPLLECFLSMRVTNKRALSLLVDIPTKNLTILKAKLTNLKIKSWKRLWIWLFECALLRMILFSLPLRDHYTYHYLSFFATLGHPGDCSRDLQLLVPSYLCVYRALRPLTNLEMLEAY